MNYIESLDELLVTLKKCDPSDYVQIAKNLRIPPSDFQKYAQWKEDSYARNCIDRTETFELILICWKEGDCTPIHNHADQRCWVYQIEGSNTEIRYKHGANNELEECNRIELKPGTLTYMEDNMGCHLLKNCTETTSMTLHLYISPIDSCEVFCDDTASFKSVDLTYDSFQGECLSQAIPKEELVN